ncbi:sodium-independent anion transporter [Bradyrhizobium sp. CCBAU 051011]|uniref:SulP family inorganic anion transporter n=1 Tax=Bradyrhizobium sp. CCBAU 051011 TaxID=858422 RepID=UPI0013743A52|nr:SulP family inorganic anion transporter [Bradyrhizobium sp. CCBAU 051011]QHO74579.1 sodium-independent anion transporter [Bradyrhizobium sp. CCBAU 051011]
MTAIDDRTAQRTFEDSPSIGSMLTSPREFTRETLAGVVTALALIPEVISFSFVSGVDPKVALFSSVVLGLVMSVLGGRPAMVTAAAGSIALVIGPMVKAYGPGYILPTIILAGIVQIAFGLLGMARLTRFIPRSVMIGFVNSLGILIFFAQVPHILNVLWIVYPLFALTIAIVLLAPRVITIIPAPLIAIVIVTAIVISGHLTVPNVGGSGGAMAPGLPGITHFVVPLNLETLSIVWPTALSVAFVGLLETLLTAKLVDDVTDSRSHKGKESWALGVANIAAGFYGGIAGCAMIAQTVVNVKIGGGRSRISTVAAAIVLLVLVTVLSSLMAQIPLVALAAVMMIAAVKTFDWHSVMPSTLKRMPKSETAVLVVTVVITVATGNLAFGIAGGVLLAMVLFARRVAHVIRVERVPSEDGSSVRYAVHGPLFFGSSNDFVERFSYRADPKEITVDLTSSQIWDASSVAALDAIETKYRALGHSIKFTGLDPRSLAFHGRLTGQLNGQ